MTPLLADLDFRPGDGFEQVTPRIRDLVDDFGLEHFSFAFLHTPEGARFSRDDTFLTTYPCEWMQRYIAKKYLDLDPVGELATKGLRPFFWGQGRFLRSYKKSQRIVFEEASEFQINYGLAVPIRGTRGEVSVFNLVTSDKRHLHDVTRGAIGRIMAAAYGTHERVIEHFDTLCAGDEKVELTIRERECLAWTLEGKTASEIGTILSLSTSTVNQHAASATHKLGSLNKHHAAVKALKAGIIH